MKKLLLALLFICTQVYSQSKVEAIVGDGESGAAIKGTAGTATGIGGHFINTSSGKALTTSGALRFGGSNVGTITNGNFLKATNTDGDAQWAGLFPADYDLTLSNGIALYLRNLSTTANYSTIFGVTSSNKPGVSAI